MMYGRLPDPTPEQLAAQHEQRGQELYVAIWNRVAMLALHTGQTPRQVVRAFHDAIASDDEWESGLRDSAVDDVASAMLNGDAV
jgi:hypothetical protein